MRLSWNHYIATATKEDKHISQPFTYITYTSMVIFRNQYEDLLASGKVIEDEDACIIGFINTLIDLVFIDKI